MNRLLILWLIAICFVFFFKQKTAYEMRISYWSSDVCSSDLGADSIHPMMPISAGTANDRQADCPDYRRFWQYWALPRKRAPGALFRDWSRQVEWRYRLSGTRSRSH